MWLLMSLASSTNRKRWPRAETIFGVVTSVQVRGLPIDPLRAAAETEIDARDLIVPAHVVPPSAAP